MAAEAITDHDRIRKWAEARRARPACVVRTGNPPVLRFDFPRVRASEPLQAISWAQWFKMFDENRLALLIEEDAEDGKKSQFNRLVSRETANVR